MTTSQRDRDEDVMSKSDLPFVLNVVDNVRKDYRQETEDNKGASEYSTGRTSPYDRSALRERGKRTTCLWTSSPPAMNIEEEIRDRFSAANGNRRP